MSRSGKLPPFSREPWYTDPTDPRCPLDGALESLEIIPASDSTANDRSVSIKLTLASAHQTGWIVFNYGEVRSHSLKSYSCDQGVGDWLRDEFSITSADLVCHRITWNCPTSGTSQWLIEAAEVSYEWVPEEV